MMAGRLFTGTSGYSYKEWRGAFFPEDLAPDQFLSYYSRKLRSVEINNTFYRFPTETVLEHWRDETPESFVFAVKANQRITHKLRLKKRRTSHRGLRRTLRGGGRTSWATAVPASAELRAQ